MYKMTCTSSTNVGNYCCNQTHLQLFLQTGDHKHKLSCPCWLSTEGSYQDKPYLLKQNTRHGGLQNIQCLREHLTCSCLVPMWCDINFSSTFTEQGHSYRNMGKKHSWDNLVPRQPKKDNILNKRYPLTWKITACFSLEMVTALFLTFPTDIGVYSSGRPQNGLSRWVPCSVFMGHHGAVHSCNMKSPWYYLSPSKKVSPNTAQPLSNPGVKLFLQVIVVLYFTPAEGNSNFVADFNR